METVSGGQERPNWPLMRVSLGLALCICIAVNPQAHLFGRFWAEEGTDLFENLLGAGPLAMFTYLYKGTLLLTSNIAVWLAGAISVRYAPLITTWISTIAILNLAYLFALWGRSIGVGHRNILLALAAFLLGGISFEIISNATNLQWVFSFLVLVIAFLPASVISSKKIYTTVIVVLGGLSGVPSCMMAPIMMVRAYTERSRAHFLFSIILGCCALLQLFFITNAETGPRDFSFDLFEMIYLATIRPGIWLVLSPKGAELVLAFVVENVPLALLYGTAILLIAGVVATLFRIQQRTDRAAALTLLAAWFLVTMLNIFGGLSDSFDPKLGIDGGRYYAFASLCALMIALIVSKANTSLNAVVMVALVWITAINGAYSAATHPIRRYGALPSWQSQVDACQVRVVQTCELQIWPNDPSKNDWVVVIEKEKLY